MSAGHLSLVEAFELNAAGQLVAIVGGGGKSSLMFALARALPGRVVMSTTTRIFAAQMKAAPATLFAGRRLMADTSLAGDWPELGDCLAESGRCLVVGRVSGQKAGGVPPDLPGRLLARPDVDYVVVEADGSRMLPCKAPAGHEPVIPPESTLVVPTAGIDALDGPIAEVAHRPERVADVTGQGLEERLTPETLARLLVDTSGGLKAVPAAARVTPLLNKVESPRQLAAARQTAHFILRSERVSQVVAGAMGTAERPREVYKRVTAVLLAAGESRRMGQSKLLLPWGESTVLGQTLANAAQSLAHETLVVTGHERQATSAIAAEMGAPSLYNPDYAGGEMLSSLQIAARTLPANRAAVLVMLADQPMVRSETIDQLLIAYWQGRGRLVAPLYDGRRGNPVIIDRYFFEELLGLPPGDAPRTLLRRHADQLYLLNVDDPAVLLDLDNPADYERWRPGQRDAD